MPIHTTATIDQLASIDPSAIIGPHVVIDGPVCIGPNTVIDPFVYITGCTKIGADCHIHSGSVIGDVPQDMSYSGEESYCIVGDESVIREGVTIHRGTRPGSATIVGSRCLLMANSHVAHDCTLEDEVILTNGALLGGFVQIGFRAFISGNAAVHQFVRIGDVAMVSGLAKVTQDVPPYFLTDRDGKCLGINRIGMRRAGISAGESEEIRSAFRIMYRTAGTLGEAIAELEQSIVSNAGCRLVDFLREPSSRGVAGPSKSQRCHSRSDPFMVCEPTPLESGVS